MRRLEDDAGARFTFVFDGAEVQAVEGDSVAAALLASGHRTLRTTPVSGASRGPYCMMGACFECLVTIDGVPNLQACMVPARPGIEVHPMAGARETGASS